MHYRRNGDRICENPNKLGQKKKEEDDGGGRRNEREVIVRFGLRDVGMSSLNVYKCCNREVS